MHGDNNEKVFEEEIFYLLVQGDKIFNEVPYYLTNIKCSFKIAD